MSLNEVGAPELDGPLSLVEVGAAAEAVEVGLPPAAEEAPATADEAEDMAAEGVGRPPSNDEVES